MNVYVGVGAAEVLLFLVLIWSLILWARYPGWAWTESGHSKSLWLLLLILAFFLPCFGYILALWFIFSVSTDVRRIAKLGHRPGFPTG